MITTTKPDLLLAGCGRMGAAMLSGWVSASIFNRCTILDPAVDNLDPALITAPGITTARTPDDLPEAARADITVLAVKPQMMDGLLASLAPRFSDARGGAVLSVAAGRAIASFKGALGDHVPVVRAMPNTPAAIGRGVSVAVASPDCSDAVRRLSGDLLAAAGTVEWLEDEALMDAVTAVSGSGPAWLFHLVEALAGAGAAEGLSPDMAMRLARQTVIGAAALLEHSDIPAEELRRNVTSPGGTTAAGLAILMDGTGGLPPLMQRTVAAAAARARELNG